MQVFLMGFQTDDFCNEAATPLNHTHPTCITDLVTDLCYATERTAKDAMMVCARELTNQIGNKLYLDSFAWQKYATAQQWARTPEGLRMIAEQSQPILAKLKERMTGKTTFRVITYFDGALPELTTEVLPNHPNLIASWNN